MDAFAMFLLAELEHRSSVRAVMVTLPSNDMWSRKRFPDVSQRAEVVFEMPYWHLWELLPLEDLGKIARAVVDEYLKRDL